MADRKYTALLLAAQRPGVTNAIAEAYGESHKCRVAVAGKPMIERVVANLMATPEVDKIVISIEEPDVLLVLPEIKRLHEEGTISFAKSERTLADSVLAAIDMMGDDAMPFFITTADNCLHTPEIISYFLQEVTKADAEAAFAMTPDTLVQETYPGTGKITGQHKFRDGIYSNCNIYAICTPRAKATAELFRKGGQFGNNKKKKALIPVVGLWPFILYRYGLVTFDGLVKRASKAFGIRAKGVVLPFADAPIDADDIVSLKFIEARLNERENGVKKAG